MSAQTTVEVPGYPRHPTSIMVYDTVGWIKLKQNSDVNLDKLVFNLQLHVLIKLTHLNY